MGYFSQLDIERQQLNKHARHRGWIDDPGPTIDRPTFPPVGCMGVNMADNGNPPTFWELSARVGCLGFFREIGNPANKTNFSMSDFWPLT